VNDISRMSVAVGRPWWDGNAVKINFIPRRFKEGQPSLHSIDLTREGCAASLAIVAQHARAHETVLRVCTVRVISSIFPASEVRVEAPVGKEAFTLLELAEALIKAYQSAVEAPGHLEEHSAYQANESTEEALSRYMLSDVIYVVKSFYGHDAGVLYAMGGFGPVRSLAERQGIRVLQDWERERNEEQALREARGITFALPPNPSLPVPTDDDDEPVEEDWPYVSLTPEFIANALPRVRNVDAVVIPRGAIRMRFSTPLAQPVTVELRAPEGHGAFTRRALVEAISAVYQRIYREEAEAVETRGVASDRGSPNSAGNIQLANRTATNGPYGIGHHDLGDLALNLVEHDPEQDVYTMVIDT